MADLPVRFEERMKELLGDEYQDFAASYDRERVQGLRLNGLKTEQDEAWEITGAPALADYIRRETGFGLEKIPWVKEGYYYGGNDRPGRHPFHEAGLYYIQEPSAMAVAELLDPRPGERVLDLCAAPGGKSSHIASRLKGRGFLLSNEIHPARAKILSQNMERMGVRNAVVSNEDSAHLARIFHGFFHKIVVDAPCSGEGMFRKDQEARTQWSEEHVRMCAARQGEILDNAASMLAPGGRMVYSTCTFAPEENEGTVLDFLKRHPEFRTEQVKACPGFTEGQPRWAGFGREEEEPEREPEREPGEKPLDEYHLEYTFRIMPHKLEGEGHFMAVLRKAGGGEANGEASNGEKAQGEKAKGGALSRNPMYLDAGKRKEVFRDFEPFIRNTMTEPDRFLDRMEYVLFGDQLYLLPPDMPDMKGIKILRPGLHMGTLKKNRFEPSHALALALRKDQVKLSRELPPGEDGSSRYLKGETLILEDRGGEEEPKGWVLVCTGGFSLGWAKCAGGMLKNHYPKGLRQ